jgi:hypothetical protein
MADDRECEGRNPVGPLLAWIIAGRLHRKWQLVGSCAYLAVFGLIHTSEIEAAGFKLIDHGDFLHVPGDTRDAPSHSSAQPVDIYMLKFRKPG